MHYTIKDVQTGHEFVSTNVYAYAARTFFDILEKVYDWEDNGYLRLVDNRTNRSMSVVVPEE